jgi:hypothetical protein
MSARITRWLAASLLALLLSSAWMLDGPSELQAMQDVAADVHEVTTTAQVQP